MHDYPSHQEVKEARYHLIDVLIDNWLGDTFLQWEWWLLIALIFLPWIIWWKFVDKSKLNLIFSYGLMILFLNGFLDDLGTGLSWWYYPHKVIPTLHVFKAPDFAIIPCIMMLAFQYFRTWKPFIISTVILAVLFSQVGERLFIQFGFYELIKWKLLYSFFHYIIVAILSRWVVCKVEKISKQN